MHAPITCLRCCFLLYVASQVYYGAPSALPAYCTGLGKEPPAYSNIGEFFLEVVDEYEANDNVKVRFVRRPPASRTGPHPSDC